MLGNKKTTQLLPYKIIITIKYWICLDNIKYLKFPYLLIIETGKNQPCFKLIYNEWY